MNGTKYENNLENWEFVRNLTEKEFREVSSAKDYRPSIIGIWRCKRCGNLFPSENRSFKRYLKLCPNGCQGEMRGGKIVVSGVDDFATLYPELVKYFVDKDMATKRSAKSAECVDLLCPDCGEVKKSKIHALANYGFYCHSCANKTSFSEKAIAILLKSLGIFFLRQYSIKGEGMSKRYDFYIPSHNIVIETHGIQHYERSGFAKMGGRTLEEEQENDKYKEQLALSKGYKYIVLDCRKSEMSWIKESVVNSDLDVIFDLSSIDWNQIETKINSEDSLFNTVVKRYNAKPNINRVIADELGVNQATISDILIRADKMGLCNYVRGQGGYLARKVVFIKEEEINGVFSSCNETSRQLNYAQRDVSNLCLGKGKCNNVHFVNSRKYGYIGFYYLDSEDWERDKHLYLDPYGLLK